LYGSQFASMLRCRMIYIMGEQQWRDLRFESGRAIFSWRGATGQHSEKI